MGASLQGLDRFKFDVGGSNIIKDIQTGELNLTSTYDIKNYEKNVAINPIDLTKSIIICYVRGGSSSFRENSVRAKFINNSTINFKRGLADSSASIVVVYYVITFENIKSLQSGVIENYSSTQLITINPVNVNNSMVFSSFAVASNYEVAPITPIKLTNSTTLTIDCIGDHNYCSWFVMEKL